MKRTTQNADIIREFTKATPSGTIEICMDNESSASEFFEPGKTYRLTFEVIEEDNQG